MAGYNDLAPGFYTVEDRLGETLSSYGYENSYELLLQSAAIHTATINSLFANAVERVTWAKKRVHVRGGRSVQVMGQNDNPKPRRAGLWFDTGLPLRIAADSIGDNMWARSKTTLQQLNADMLEVQMAFDDWIYLNFLSAIFNDAEWTYADDDDDIGSLTIKTFANGSTQKYPVRSGGTATANHFLYQSNSIADAYNPFPTIRDTLKVHPTNAGATPVVYIASNLRTSVEGLATFKDVPNQLVAYGDDTDLAVERINQYIGWGNEVVGFADDCVIVEADRIPDSYMHFQAVGTGTKPVAMREPEEAEMRGIVMPDAVRVSSNLQQIDMYMRAGFGVQNPVAGGAMLIGAGAYTPPTGYGDGAPITVDPS